MLVLRRQLGKNLKRTADIAGNLNNIRLLYKLRSRKVGFMYKKSPPVRRGLFCLILKCEPRAVFFSDLAEIEGRILVYVVDPVGEKKGGTGSPGDIGIV